MWARLAVTCKPSSTPTTHLMRPSTPSAAPSARPLHPPAPASTDATSSIRCRQWRCRLGTLSGITYLISDQTSNYNGLQVSATKQMSRGFSVSGFYVWSRALESSNPVENGAMSAQDFGVLGKPFTPIQQLHAAPSAAALREEYGPMDQNHDSNAAISGMWNINYFHGSNRIVKEVVNGWTISPVVYLISGGAVYGVHGIQQ